MAKFNVVQKRRRAAVANRKRQVHGDPVSRKLHQKSQTLSISGKRKRKLLKKWRRDQKEAVEKGLISMQDVEMEIADGNLEPSESASKAAVKFPMKKSSKLRVKQLKKKGKSKKKSQRPAGEASTDSMVE
ncbi:Pm52 protein [Striga asiatica]|uniref:Pm52 protein n=1 Tax=Striga asiatica TaxID=4170 RepID=A0A5A7QQR5_STRAF|nr:Pm52 protein [Striga asiatica]